MVSRILYSFRYHGNIVEYSDPRERAGNEISIEVAEVDLVQVQLVIIVV